MSEMHGPADEVNKRRSKALAIATFKAELLEKARAAFPGDAVAVDVTLDCGNRIGLAVEHIAKIGAAEIIFRIGVSVPVSNIGAPTADGMVTDLRERLRDKLDPMPDDMAGFEAWADRRADEARAAAT